ncbi:MAG: TetR family transcriptional regulator [Gammaproteobacteria bacterium]|nr:TetR family transcriptional regulator [Gammaproteobacteria bacterium]MCP4089436.1 TetR family transcriptional regulator [Gammaproteobacteria bacterium]MCP4277552.1 TetR family transcriptional regulator [Gammaproteobacteria bacterium]MCP4831160.1 TetR family transcriptional regulator [Gammaproteobacteria bacterium]MCP4929211.1 TetR family transcriptional regulator [Gammaproteobacteria bacterium]
MPVTLARKSTKSVAREQIIAAAEHLFAESGIDAVSLRQINVAAGQKNSSAAHYHFGTKETLILSIYQVRMEHVNERRILMLEHIKQAGQQKNVRTLVEAIIHPIVAEIDEEKNGCYYIRFMAQAIGHPQLNLVTLSKQEHSGGLAQTLKLLRKALPDIPDLIFGQRFGLAFEQIIHSLSDREKLRRMPSNTFEIDANLFVSNLVDCISGAMSVPISESTRKELKRLNKKTD